jgi:hypothetical protein
MIRLDESDHDLILLLEHDLFGKPVPTFPDHALTPVTALGIGGVCGEKTSRPV